eukprot:gb/GECG01015718.1/.p1 GENE.gb/GECG01015718.1/~~gb/GECG01015718.1/.p1  ORF type:complete len:166 (+),score=12.74 gb/GECG01015718.1/:1-498(+)
MGLLLLHLVLSPRCIFCSTSSSRSGPGGYTQSTMTKRYLTGVILQGALNRISRFCSCGHNYALNCSGASAGACASWLTNPLDLAKLRLQVQRSAKARGEEGSAPFNYRHTAHALQEIATREGVRGLFRGSVARVLFHTPATAVTVSLVEQFKKVYLSMLSNDSES